MAFRVFVSYSTQDLSQAARIKELLEAAGAEVFVAEYSLPAGSTLSDAILTAIKACDLFVLLLSDSARSSEWVPQEIGAAKSQNKPIIPLLMQKGNVPGFLQGTKYLAAYDEPSRAYEWLQQHVVGQASKKNSAELLMLFGVIGVVLWAMSQKE